MGVNGVVVREPPVTAIDQHPTRLRFDGTVNIATVVMVASMAISGVWYAKDLDERQNALSTLLNSRIEQSNKRKADQEGRLRTLELQQTRSDEKFNAILEHMSAQAAALERIKDRLEVSP